MDHLRGERRNIDRCLLLWHEAWTKRGGLSMTARLRSSTGRPSLTPGRVHLECRLGTRYPRESKSLHINFER